MISPLFLSITPGTTYDQLKQPLRFVQDFAGVTNWVMRFPRTIFSSDLRTKHTFTHGEVEVSKVSNPSLEERWKYFVITRGDGRRFYCTGQVYYEKAPLKCKESALFYPSKEIFKEFFLPKCLVLMSELPYYKMQVNLLKVFRQIKRPEPIISHSVNEGLLRVYSFLLEEGRESQWEHINVNQPFECRKLTPSTEFIFNYYLTVCNQHLGGEAIFIQKQTNREVLHLYKLYPHSIYQICYIFHLPFSPPTLRLILSAILMEKQIIFTSNNPNLTTLIIETLMKMVLPLRWCYMYVPNLPSHLIEPAQESFMPYIVGMPKKYLHLIDTRERVVIYVEQDRVVYNQEMLLFDHSLVQFLTYVNSDAKNYLEWEKEIRIKSILLCNSLLEDALTWEKGRSFAKEQRLSTAQSTLRLSLAHSRMSYSKLFQTSNSLPASPNHQHSRFIQQMAKNSMMFKHYKEDSQRGMAEESLKLMQVPKQHRMSFLVNKFNLLSSQAQFPVRFDNQKHWIRYYEAANRRNKSRVNLNRDSLFIGVNHGTQSTISHQSMHSSTTQLAQSHVLSKSTLFH